MSLNTWINAIIPKPMPYELVLIGNGRDGSYLVPDDLDGIEACFSPGVNNYKYFEDYLAINHGIMSHMCDYSSDITKFSTPLIHDLQTFEKKWLDIDRGDDSISLDDWVNKYSKNSNSDLILQIDIEGAEFRNINSISNELLNRFRIIVIEIHGFARLINEVSNEVHVLINRLTHFHDVVHATANNCCGEQVDSFSGINLPNVIELTLLRKDRISSNKNLTRFPTLPHPRDINNTANRPIFLNEKWLCSEHCVFNFDKIKHDLDEWDSQFYKTRFKLLSAASKNYFDCNVFDSPSTIKADLLTDLAIGCKYFTNSKNYGFVEYKEPFFFHTSNSGIPSITIDLGQDFSLAGFEIGNRTDVHFDRASMLAYSVHSSVVYNENDIILIDVPSEFVDGKGSCLILFRNIKIARYLTVLSFKLEHLHFSSLKIYPPIV